MVVQTIQPFTNQDEGEAIFLTDKTISPTMNMTNNLNFLVDATKDSGIGSNGGIMP